MSQKRSESEEVRPKLRVKFKVLQENGTWELAEEVAAEQSAVLRVAGKYV
jgi:hypothetical protein